MELSSALKEYEELGKYFCPDYGRDNPVLSAFKATFPSLSTRQLLDLTTILEESDSWVPKYFAADLLYLYEKFDEMLLEPMINCAISYMDVSFNRIFLRPCVRVFGMTKVAEILRKKFVNGNIQQKIGVSNLIYWLRLFHKDEEPDELREVIIERANTSDNLIERYHYQFCYRNAIQDSATLPKDYIGLQNAIRGNREYEDLLYNKLGWTKDDVR